MTKFGDSFLKYCAKKNIGCWASVADVEEPYFELTGKEFRHFIEDDNAFSGMHGGLVLGNLHSEGGIHLVKPMPGTDSFAYVGEMEGWEYITSHFIFKSQTEPFVELNKETLLDPSEDTSFAIPDNCEVIDTTGIEVPVIVLEMHPQFVMNRFATRKYINRIIELDQENKKINQQNSNL